MSTITTYTTITAASRSTVDHIECLADTRAVKHANERTAKCYISVKTDNVWKVRGKKH